MVFIQKVISAVDAPCCDAVVWHEFFEIVKAGLNSGTVAFCVEIYESETEPAVFFLKIQRRRLHAIYFDKFPKMHSSF